MATEVGGTSAPSLWFVAFALVWPCCGLISPPHCITLRGVRVCVCVCVTSSVHREGGLLALQSLLPANEELFYAFHENLSQRIPAKYKDLLVKATDLLADPMVPRKSCTSVTHNTLSHTSHVTLHVTTPSVDTWGRGDQHTG
jgi:hypothetical protein